MTDAPPGAAWTAGDRFPTLAARDLEGRNCTLPDALTGEWNLVVLAFRRQQQSTVDTWSAWQREVVVDRPGLECWEVPVIGVLWAPARRFIDGGMAQAVREVEARRHTLTVYTHLATATRALDITDTGTVTPMLVDRAGRIRWRGSGAPDGRAGADILALVDAPAG